MKRSDYILNPVNHLRKKIHIEKANELILEHGENFIFKEEEKYINQIDELIDDFLSYKNKKMILVSGATSAGKTTTSNIIGKRLRRIGYNFITVSLDDFLIPLYERALLPDGSLDYDSFATVNVKRFNSFVRSLIKKQKATMPVYNFVTGTTEDEGIPVTVDENTILIVEGLHALNPALLSNKETRQISYKVYIETNSDFYYGDKLILEAEYLRLIRRSLRDYYKRGTTIDKTLALWDQTVEMENIYIKPFKEEADYIINTANQYELMIYANYLKPLLEQANSKSKLFYAIVKILDACEKLDIDLVPQDSVLWDFLDESLKKAKPTK